MALAGGVSLTFPMNHGYQYVEGMIYSPDGHCRAFSKDSAGVVSGNGVGVVLLKRLSEAIEDNDHIYAIIKGFATNNDGSNKIGFSAPSVVGQSKVILAAHEMADIDINSMGYIEAHGTGTKQGDPIEVSALQKAFKSMGALEQPYCGIGSVKSNIGHLDAAAGVAGFIKTVLSLKHKTIPPTLHAQETNPLIDFENSPFFVNSQLKKWKSSLPMRAAVSSFGIGGTNAHVVLEEAPTRKVNLQTKPGYLLCLSAKTQESLDIARQNLADCLLRQPDINLADVSYTLQTGRISYPHRWFSVADTSQEAIKALTQDSPEFNSEYTEDKSHSKEVVFMFPGQGSLSPGAGTALYQHNDSFRENIDKCATLLLRFIQQDIRQFFKEGANPAEIFQQTQFAQPLLFSLEYSLAQLWMANGVQPTAMIGHSLGEYVAACLAGIWSLEEALEIICLRGKLMQSMPEGAMLAVRLNSRELESFLSIDVSLAAINGLNNCVLSGTTEAINKLEGIFVAKNVQAKRLETNRAFHSPDIDSILSSFESSLSRFKCKELSFPLISNVTGSWLSSDEAKKPSYWSQHARRPVKFLQGIECILEKLSEPVFLELGPGKALTSFAKSATVTSQPFFGQALSNKHDKKGDYHAYLKLMGLLWLKGQKPKITIEGQKTSLPTYPFAKTRHWIETRSTIFWIYSRKKRTRGLVLYTFMAKSISK